MVATHAENSVEIPGFAEELRREKRIRSEALQPPKLLTIGGVRVRHLTLGLLIKLEAERVAFVNAWQFDSGLELAAECARFVWHVSERKRAIDRIVPWPFRAPILARERCRLVVRVADQPEALSDLRRYLDEAFYDAPVDPPDQKTPPRQFTHWVVGALGLINAGGFNFTNAELIEMRLPCLWQYYRLAAAKAGVPLINPSDVWAQKKIEEMNARARA